MARKSLRPHLNQIRSWARQGRTDAWVAHQLEVPVQDIVEFKRHNELTGAEEAEQGADHEFPEEIDLRAEDDALIAAELEAAAIEAERERAEAARKAEAKQAEADEQTEATADRASGEQGDVEGLSDADAGDHEERSGQSRRRGRRGGRDRRSRSKASAALEGTFDHGEEGYGLWLDPAIQDDPIYAEHWAGHRPVEVTIEEEQIVIRRIREDG